MPSPAVSVPHLRSSRRAAVLESPSELQSSARRAGPPPRRASPAMLPSTPSSACSSVSNLGASLSLIAACIAWC
uniref:Uncharacterized protein n=1 Tax=Arundo donax TaxID=35708 RepID=A0A0A8XWC1_ARUDO